MRRLAAWTATALLVASFTVACSSESSDDATPAPTAVGGTASCDEPTILQAVEADFAANYPGSTFVAMEDFTCTEGWAMADVQFEASDETFPTVVFLRAEGQFWVPTTIEEICATPRAESTVPEDMYVAACGVD